MTVGGMTFVHYSEVGGVFSSEVGNVWSACCCRQGARSLSIGGRLSARWSVHYRRFHCIRKRSLTKLLDHLNSVKKDIIRFTYEVEDVIALLFLDTLVTCSTEGSLETRVYRKATHTDQLLDFRSHQFEK